MGREIRLDSKYGYQDVQDCLNKISGLKRSASVGGNGHLYLNGTKNRSGVMLQQCPTTNEIIISEINSYYNFEKVEESIEELKKQSKLEATAKTD